MAYSPAATNTTVRGVQRSTLPVQAKATGAVDAAGNPTAISEAQQLTADDVNRILEIVNQHADLLDGLIPDDSDGGTDVPDGGTATGPTSSTETLTLTQSQIDSGILLAATPAPASSTTLSIGSAGGGTIPYGVDYGVSGNRLTFSASLAAQLLPGDVATITYPVAAGTGSSTGSGGGSTGTSGSSTTETITLTQAQIDFGLTLSGTPTSPASTNLTHSAAGGGTIPYGTNYTIAGDQLTFAAGFQAQLFAGDVLTIVWS